MEHADHVNLIRDGVGGGATWADLGSGTGTFTFALADLLRPGGTIYSVDRDEAALRRQARAMERSFPDVTLHQLTADFTQPLELPQLDRVVMANSLHFEREATAVVAGIVAYLRAGGRFVLVEYDTDGGNPWVPHPLSFETWTSVASGLGSLTRVASHRSRAGSWDRCTRRSACARSSAHAATAWRPPGS